MSPPDRFRDDLGAYALGALAAGEARALRGHLRGCPECRRELAELQSVAPMVVRARVGEGPPVGSGAAGKRRRFPRLIAVGAAIGATAVALGAATVLFGGSAETVAFRSTPGWPQARGTVTYEPTSWGTQLVIRVSGLPATLRCQIWVKGQDGSWQQAGSWRAVGGGATAVEAASVLTLSRIGGVALETPQRQELLWAAAPHRKS